MKQCRLTGSFLAFVIVIMFSASSGADVYINDYPADISLEEGKPLEVPLILTGGSNTGKPVELYIWREGLQSGSRKYFGPAGWVPFTDFADMKSVISVDTMVQHLYFVWPAIGDTTGIESFKLSVCMDSNVDGLLGPDTSTCDERGVQITAPPACSGLIATPGSIIKSVEKGASGLPVQITVTDSCGNPATFNAAASQSWIGLAKQQGLLTVTLNATTLTAASYSGAITLTSGIASTTVAALLKVTSPAPPISPCTASSAVVLPISISTETGTTRQASTSVTNNCGTAITYSAAVTSGNAWLSVPATGSGTITVTVNAAGLAAGTYQGVISLSAGGLPTATLNVYLTVTGGCIPNTVIIDPPAISKSPFPGTNADSVVVTVSDNCGADLDYTITDVSAAWTAGFGITSPAKDFSGKGSFTVSFNTCMLLAPGTYTGNISFAVRLSDDAQLQSFSIPVKVNVPIVDGWMGTSLLNGGNSYYGFNPGDVRWFYFVENTSDGVNDSELVIQIADMIQANGFYNVDLLVRYAGPTCDDSKMPSPNDIDRYRRGEISSADGFYASFSSDAFETVIVNNNPNGCYYVMVANVDVGAESKIRIKYSDADSPVNNICSNIVY